MMKRTASLCGSRVYAGMNICTPRAQDEQGRWITKNDRYKCYTPGVRWNGEYETQDRISSRVFNNNIQTLCAFLEKQ